MITGKKLEERMESLDPDFSKYKDAKITGKRLFTEVTFNPSVINPGESVYISVPTLGANMCLVPDTFFLTAKFKSKNTKSWFLNNLGRLLVKQLQVMVGSREALLHERSGKFVFRIQGSMVTNGSEKQYGGCGNHERKYQKTNVRRRQRR